MNYFRELNNYVEDIPMRFSEKILSFQLPESIVNHTFQDDSNIDMFNVDDYKFNSELIAIEMYELHEKKKQEEAIKTPSRVSKPLKSNHQSYASVSYKENISSYSNNLFRNLVFGEILQPQPLANSSTADLNTHSNCDNYPCDKKDELISKTNLVNPKEFENDESSPFDNVELQTIDDLKELNHVFQALNTNNEPKGNELPVKQNNSLASGVITSENYVTSSSSVPHSTPLYYSNPTHYARTALYSANSSVLNQDNLNTSLNYNNSFITAPQLTNAQYLPYYQNQTNHLGTMPDYNSNSNLPFYNVASPYAAGPNMMASQCNAYSPVEMKRSSSEKKDLCASGALTSQPLSLTARSKSVSDLSQMGRASDTVSMQESSCEVPVDRSKTPPALANHLSGATMAKPRPLALADPYLTLSPTEKQFVDELCQMGFKRDRISRAVKHIDVSDDKKLFEYLLTLQQLEDGGYDCYDAEIALHMNNYHKDDAEAFLKTLKQICDFGFDKEASIKALFKSNNDRDKAIDLLLNSN